MNPKIVIPVENEKGESATLSAHFGRAPFFAIVEQEEGEIAAVISIPNQGAHSGCGPLVNRILAHQPDIVITTGMGQRPILIFQQNGVGVLKAPPGTVKSAMQLFLQNMLPELTDGCGGAHH